MYLTSFVLLVVCLVEFGCCVLFGLLLVALWWLLVFWWFVFDFRFDVLRLVFDGFAVLVVLLAWFAGFGCCT